MTSAHWHLMLNHVPLLGLLFGTGLLTYGLWGAYENVQKGSLALLAVAGLSAVAVYLTGEPAEEVIEGLAGVSHEALEAHEGFGIVALTAGLVTGLSALGALLYGRLRRSIARWTVILTLGLAVVSIGFLAYTANLGGKISHPELRERTSETTIQESSETILPPLETPQTENDGN